MKMRESGISIALFVYSLLALTLIRCSSDYSDELTGDYFYRDEGGEIKQILSHTPNRRNIYGRVTSYVYNSSFIIVLQEPSKPDHISMIAFDLRDELGKYPANTKEEILQSENEADSILKNDRYYTNVFANRVNYWIISHKNDTVIGPLSQSEYFVKRRELLVPDYLQLGE